MVIFGYDKEAIRDLQAEIKALKADIDILSSRIQSLKGYVYAKKIRLEEEQPEDLNRGLPAIPLNELANPYRR